MKRIKNLIPLMLAVSSTLDISADERRFTYSYEPEVLPKGALEFEQWVSLRSQRTSAGSVGRENFNRWDIREELEYGVTDRYTIGLYLNGRNDSYKNAKVDPRTEVSSFDFKGVSVENRYMVLNPAENPIGLTLYGEGTFAGDEAELEQKIIFGQRHNDWKWTVNLIHETEWEHHFDEMKGEVEIAMGITRDLNPNWSVGVEVRDHNELPEYETWDNTAIYVGPVVSFRQEKWWATLSFMPQVYGRNFNGNPDGYRNLDLARHERYTARLLIGISL